MAYPRGTAIESTFVWGRSPIVGWRDNGNLQVRSLTEDRPYAIGPRDGTLYRQGDAAITLKHQLRLEALADSAQNRDEDATKTLAREDFLYDIKGAAFGRAGAGCGRPQAAVLAGANHDQD
jgi:hypothetical protein